MNQTPSFYVNDFSVFECVGKGMCIIILVKIHMFRTFKAFLLLYEVFKCHAFF